jgi:dopamine beta-monooxygenase
MLFLFCLYRYTTAIEVMPGDEIVTSCTFKSLSRPKTTFYGDATSDEMCFGFMAYYPADNLQLPVCTAWKEISTCGLLSGNHKGCDIYSFLNTAHVNTLATMKLVQDNCKAFGNCLKECKPVLEKLFKEHPCLKGDVYDLIREQARRLTNLKLIEFIAAIESCKLEMSRSNEDTNRSSHLNAMSAMGISVLIAVQLLFN